MFLAAKIAIAAACKSPMIDLALMKQKLTWIMLHKKLVSVLRDKQSLFERIWTLSLLSSGLGHLRLTAVWWLDGFLDGRALTLSFLVFSSPCFVFSILLSLSLYLKFLFLLFWCIVGPTVGFYPRFKVNCKVLLMTNYLKRFFIWYLLIFTDWYYRGYIWSITLL